MSRPDMVVDLETAPCADVLPLLEPVSAAKNLKDPEKVKADVEARTKDRDAKLSLDPYCCRIVALGTWTEASGLRAVVCPDEASERRALDGLSRDIKDMNARLVGYCILRFDLCVLLARSRLLGVPMPRIDTRRFGNRDVLDLHSVLTNDGNEPDAVLSRRLQVMARRFGLPVEDTTTGADIGALVAEGAWEQVRTHCLADVETTRALAARLGLLAPVDTWDEDELPV